MEGIPKSSEKIHDPFLTQLWVEYDFGGKPPFAGSVAENKLKEVCDAYADCVDRDKDELPGDKAIAYGGVKKVSASESHRREIHDKIAVMVAGRQRTGMEDDLADQITNFAYEYSRGYKIGEEKNMGK